MSGIEESRVAVSMIRSLMYFLERNGLDAPALAREAGVSTDALADPDRRVAGACYAALMQTGIRHTDDPLLGLRFGMAVEPDRWGLLGVLVAHCASLREVIRFQLRFQSLVSTVGQASLRADETLLHWNVAPDTPAALTEEALGAYVAFGRWATGRPAMAPAAVRFSHQPQAGRERYERFFACPVAFGQPRDEIEIPASALDAPLRNPDADLKDWLARRARRLQKTLLADDARTLLGQWLARELPFGVPDLEQAAAALDLAPRRLQRELAEHDSSFTDHLAQTRRDLAQHYLRDPSLAIGEIGALLGFSEQSAFQRAFKRWYGVTPRAYRRQLADRDGF